MNKKLSLPIVGARYFLYWDKKETVFKLERLYKDKEKYFCVLLDLQGKTTKISLNTFNNRLLDNPITKQDEKELLQQKNKDICMFVCVTANRSKLIKGLQIVDKIYYINEDKIATISINKPHLHYEDKYYNEIPDWAPQILIDKYNKVKLSI